MCILIRSLLVFFVVVVVVVVLYRFHPNVASMVDWAFKYIKLPTTAT